MFLLEQVAGRQHGGRHEGRNPEIFYGTRVPTRLQFMEEDMTLTNKSKSLGKEVGFGGGKGGARAGGSAPEAMGGCKGGHCQIALTN